MYIPSKLDKKLILLSKGHLVDTNLTTLERLRLFFDEYLEHTLHTEDDRYNMLASCVCRVSSAVENNDYFLIDILKLMTTRETKLYDSIVGSEKWDYTTATQRLITLSLMPYLRNLKIKEKRNDKVQVLIDLDITE